MRIKQEREMAMNAKQIMIENGKVFFYLKWSLFKKWIKKYFIGLVLEVAALIAFMCVIGMSNINF